MARVHLARPISADFLGERLPIANQASGQLFCIHRFRPAQFAAAGELESESRFEKSVCLVSAFFLAPRQLELELELAIKVAANFRRLVFAARPPTNWPRRSRHLLPPGRRRLWPPASGGAIIAHQERPLAALANQSRRRHSSRARSMARPFGLEPARRPQATAMVTKTALCKGWPRERRHTAIKGTRLHCVWPAA